MGIWKNDRYHGPGILIRDGAHYSGDFQEGVLVGGNSVAEIKHDVKWNALFQSCAELLHHMVRY